MTVVVDDPLIAGMAIGGRCRCTSPAGGCASCIRECPRVYGVAVMGDLSRRRWWPLAEALATDRLQRCSTRPPRRRTAVGVAQQLAATLAHVVIGRVVPLLVLEGRAWDTGLENLWVHVDSEGAIDWVGVVDPTLRALPDDAHFRTARVPPSTGSSRLPNEAALTTWVAHRSHRTLEPLFARLAEVSDGAMSIAAMWHVVGAAVVSAATQVPLLAGTSELTSMRRGQAVLDALVGFGAPVRGVRRACAGKALLN